MTKNKEKLIQVKPFVQTDDSRCGPATLKMVMEYFGMMISEDRLCALTGHTYEVGCKNSDMKRVLDSFGFQTFEKEHSTISDLKYWLDRKIPVIVDWFSPGVNIGKSDVPNGHASIVVGLNDKHIYLLDPEDGKVRKILINDFLRVWFDWEGSEYIQPNTKMNIRYMLVAYKN